MLVIKDIVNYDVDALERMCDEAFSKLEKDKTLRERSLPVKALDVSLQIAQYVCIVCLAIITGIFICKADLRLTLIPLFIMLAALSAAWLLLHVQDKKHDQRRGIAKACFAPSIQYHQFIRNRTFLACFGNIIEDSMFLATVIAVEEANTDEDDDALQDRICITPIMFHFDNRVPIGVLTLDVKNGVVFYATEGEHTSQD